MQKGGPVQQGEAVQKIEGPAQHSDGAVQQSAVMDYGPQYVERTIYGPQWTTETRTVTAIECRPETRTRSIFLNASGRL